MRFSTYLKKIPHPEKAGWTVLYSTRRASLALLPDRAAARLEQGLPLSEPEMAALARLGMIIDDPETDRAAAHGLMQEINRFSSTLSVAVILSLDCNFKCCYCYEGSLKTSRNMSEATAGQVIEFVRARFRPGHKRLVLDFYGGEPLLAVGRLKQLVRPLREFAEAQGAEFYFTLVTNGSLLTSRIAAELKDYGLRIAKVTLDGPAEVHNRSRPFRNGKGSFERIFPIS